MKIIHFESIDSTNNYAKSHLSDGDMIVTANRQTAGRGSKNRSFDSGMGGLYLTKLTHYTDFSASEVFKIMINTSVAVCKTMQDFSLTPTIKWPNDVYVNSKKICGILIENTFSGSKVATSVVGIGLNINNALPEELKEIAISMSDCLQKELSVDAVRERLVAHLTEDYTVEEYKKYIPFFGEEIYLLQGETRKKVVAKDVDNWGRLIVEDENGTYFVTAGEVSLRLK